MSSLSFGTAAMFAFVVATQVIAVGLMPRTAGFTDPLWTPVMIGTYTVSMWCLSYMIHKGMPLALLVPALSALVPLITIFVGVFIYKEMASVAKMVTLCVACGLVGMASTMK